MRELDYYGDPERYEAEYGFYTVDLSWYRSRLLELGGPARVLGCGTGRVLFSLAAAGIPADGIDSSPAMLDRARGRAVETGSEIAGRVNLFEGDIRSFSLQSRYRVILAPFNLLMHLHRDEEVLGCLDCVGDHLDEAGMFLLDVTNPQPELLVRHGPPGLPLRDIRWRGATYLQSEQHEYDQATKISETLFIYEPRAADAQPFVCRLRLRMYAPGDIDALLEQAGFEISRKLGSFNGETFGQESPMQIIEAATTRRGRRS
jgi:SAM-dependent methyltransferase